MILPLIEVIDLIYNLKGGHGLRVEDSTGVRTVSLIRKIKVLLEEVEEAFGDYSVWGGDNDFEETCSIVSSDPSEAWSEYTVKSVASWKERTSWFLRPRDKKRSVVENSSAVGNHISGPVEEQTDSASRQLRW